MNYTIEDIAKELGMSKTTVSRAISGKGRISEATRERVNEFIKKVNYTPNAVAQSLAASKTFNLGLIFPHDSSLDEMPYFQNVMAGVCEVAAEFNYDVLVVLADNNDISGLERAVLNKKLDGVVVSRCVKDSRVIQYLKQNHLPYIVLGNPLDEEVLYVDNDNKNAATKMMEALTNQGLKRFALIGGNDTLYVTQSRLEGYLEGVRNADFESSKELVYLNMHRGERMSFVLSSIMKNEVDCIVCMDDMLCNSVLLTLQNMGVSVPKDVKLVSFYDSRLLSNHKPSITSLSFDSRNLGSIGAEMLLRKINGEVAQNHVLTDYNLQMRESTRDIVFG